MASTLHLHASQHLHVHAAAQPSAQLEGRSRQLAQVLVCRSNPSSSRSSSSCSSSSSSSSSRMRACSHDSRLEVRVVAEGSGRRGREGMRGAEEFAVRVCSLASHHAPPFRYHPNQSGRSHFRLEAVAVPAVIGEGGEEKEPANGSATAVQNTEESIGLLNSPRQQQEGEEDGEKQPLLPAEETAKVAKPLLTWRLLIGLILQERLKVTLVVLALVGGTFCNVTMPRLSGGFFQSLVAASDASLVATLAPLACLYALEPLFTVLYVSTLCSLWEGVMATLRKLVFERIVLQKVEFFDRHKVSDLTALLSTDLGSIDKIVAENVTRDRGLRSLCEVTTSLAILFFLSKDLAPFLSLLIVGISVGAGLYKRAILPMLMKNIAAQSKVISCAAETFAAFRTVRSFGGEKRQIALFNSLVEVSREISNWLSVRKSANEAWTRAAVYVSLLGVYYFGGRKVQLGQLPAGSIITFTGYTFILTFAIQGLVNTIADLQNVQSAFNRINGILSTQGPATMGAAGKSGLAESSQNGTLEPKQDLNLASELAWKGDLSLQGVRFSYPERPDAHVLRGITLTLPRASVTAFVGPSGAGKSTVVQLISRFYEPQSGQITLGGIPLSSFEQPCWAKAVSLVNQEPVLFAMPVRDNIAYGLPDEEVSEEAIVAAAKAANAHEFIINLPQGYDTNVGERGGLLSGGQRQRVAIARAIMKNSPILILDEATSALDSVSERLVQDALQRLMKGRTTLVIAHRLSTIQAADQIVVLTEGRIVEQGKHADLLAKGGAYAKLVNSQNLTIE